MQKILACKNRHWRKCSLSQEDTGFVHFLLHESKLKFMPERKLLNSLLWKMCLIGCKLRWKIPYILYVFLLSKGFFGQKSWKLTEHYLNFLCTWKLIFPPYLLIANCLYTTFFFGHPIVYTCICKDCSKHVESSVDKKNPGCADLFSEAAKTLKMTSFIHFLIHFWIQEQRIETLFCMGLGFFNGTFSPPAPPPLRMCPD